MFVSAIMQEKGTKTRRCQHNAKSLELALSGERQRADNVYS
jgi:hypothetical protein